MILINERNKQTSNIRYDQALMNEIKALASKIPLANLKSKQQQH